MISACALRQLASAKLTYFQIMRLDPLVNEAGLVWPYLSTLSSLLGDVAVTYTGDCQHFQARRRRFRFKRLIIQRGKSQCLGLVALAAKRYQHQPKYESGRRKLS
jgi:hypothetical protein